MKMISWKNSQTVTELNSYFVIQVQPTGDKICSIPDQVPIFLMTSENGRSIGDGDSSSCLKVSLNKITVSLL